MKFLQDWSPLRTRYCSIEPFTMMALGTGLQAGGLIFSGIMGKSAAKKQAGRFASRRIRQKGAVRSIPIWRPANYGRFGSAAIRPADCY